MSSEQGRFRHSEGYRLDYLVDVPDRPASPYLHVFCHGLSRIESQVPPVFARRAWARTLDAACLFLSDPIHRLTPDSACGWYLLGEDEFLPQVHALQAELLHRHGLSGTVWHGLSSGGYAAIKYLVRSGRDGLAFVVSPHNDPAVLPQWEQEARPWSGLPSMAAPRPTVDLLADWGAGGARHRLHALVSELDSYYALEHLRPIMRAFDGDDRARAVLLRNGRGHGFIADADYGSQLRTALDDWERGAVGPVEVELSAPLARFTGNLRHFTVEGGALPQVLNGIRTRFPDLARHVFDSSGRPLPFVNLYVDDADVRSLRSFDTVLPSGTRMLIMSAVAGG
ncbi:hypothetical protein [Kitasatospora sp. NRRL B-11411]|uniref:hypothetical protein n=1 Tax=Kitasatospora sp. NRRL B-11411 TaxID=1463822 RepID=UPI000690EBD9|nr:hypothetical protein [Kitasatospora sp. NRRL B-11411]